MKVKFVCVVLVLALGFILRYQHYSEIPAVGDSFDEYSNAWVGMSLIQIGVPIGAMGVGGYTNTRFDYVNVDQVFQSGIYPNPIQINWPWFDHPPMMGLVSGGFATLHGARVFEDATLRVIRVPMIVLGVLSIGLVIVLGWELYGFVAGILSGVLYAISPLIVVSSRMVQAENAVVPLFLLGVIFTVRYARTRQNTFLFLAIICAGCGLWFKLSAVAIFLVILTLVPKRMWGWSMLCYLPFFIAWIGYGMIFGGDTFLRVFLANSHRVYGMGPQAFFEFVTLTRISHTKFMTDGLMLSSIIATFGLFWQTRVHRILLSCIGVYLAIYLLFGNYPYGWYSLPLWPFLFIGLGKLFAGFWRTPEAGVLPLLLVLLPSGLLVSKLVSAEVFQAYSQFWKWGVGLGILSVVFFPKHSFIYRSLAFLLFVVFLALNIIYLQKITPDYWFKIS